MRRQPPDAAQLRFNGSSEAEASGLTSSTGAAVTLHYRTGWSQPDILYSVQGSDWDRRPLETVASSERSQWKAATFPLKGGANSASPLLEFVITNGTDWDKPFDGSNYTINEHGRYTLLDGEIVAVPGEPVLVVTDLDDTLIGDDEATAAFTRWWQSAAVPRGSRLVFNTGRSLAKCQALLAEKGHVLPQPDYLISSVGTKVYHNDGGEWVEDAQHAQRLDEGWSLEMVREAAYAGFQAAGTTNMHFRPPDEQNEHKVTCGVLAAELPWVLERIQSVLDAGGVRARLITSGVGDWKYLDIVSQNAGKLEAMQHVQQRLGFATSNTLAFGDSGNDIAMFEGAFKSIAVGNAQPDLLEWLQRQAGSEDGRLLLTQQTRARGILEGLEHFGFL